MDHSNAQHLPDLDQADVKEIELNPLFYGDQDYAKKEQIIGFLNKHWDDETVVPNLAELSVNGMVIQEDMELYLANKSVSSSACKEALKTPLHYFHYVMNSIPKKDKEHFKLGTFCHLAFLQPELFDLVVVEPSASLASNEGVDTLIKFWEEQLDQETLLLTKAAAIQSGADLTKLQGKKNYYKLLTVASGKVSVDEEHAIIINIIKTNYERYAGGIIPRLLKGAICETSIYGTDPSTGLGVKIRPDAMNFKENVGADMIISFKTTTAETIEKFMYDSAQYKYELSEGMYLDVASNVTGRKFNCVVTIMLQTVAPYLPAVLFWSPDDLQNGKYKYHSALQSIRECEMLQRYPGFDSLSESGSMGIIEMKQPDWAMKELLPVSIIL